MTFITDPQITLTLDAHFVQDLRLRWMATSARRALAYARATLYVRTDSYRETMSHLPCGAQDGEADRIESLEYEHEAALEHIEILTTAIESAGLHPIDSTSSGFGGDIANQHEAALGLLDLVEVTGSSLIGVALQSVTQQQNLLERVIARAGF
jgi:hypothetical protein